MGHRAPAEDCAASVAAEALPRRRRAAFTVLFIGMVVVMGPKPPGRGVTVAVAWMSKGAMGLAAVSVRPRTTAFAPSIGILFRRRICMQPAGVHATRPGRPLTRRPRFTG